GRQHTQLSESVAALTEEKLQLSGQGNAKQQALFDGMVEGVLVIREDGRIEFLNLSLKRLLGLVSDVRGQPLDHALALPSLRDILRRVASDGQMVGVELDLSETRGRFLQLNASALPGPDGSRRVLFIFHDLTRVKQFENSRRDFVANVSHELRTPLTLIK